MKGDRIIVAGEATPFVRHLRSLGVRVATVRGNLRAVNEVANGGWDACVLDGSALDAGAHKVVRMARESQPDLAMLLRAVEPAAFERTCIEVGVDACLPEEPDAAGRRLFQALAVRRARSLRMATDPACNVLLLDWDPVQAPSVRAALHVANYAVTRAKSAEEALSRMRRDDVHVCIAPARARFEDRPFVELALSFDPRLRVIVTGDNPDLEDTMLALSFGASDYLLSPVGAQQAVGSVANAWKAYRHGRPSNKAPPGGLRVLIVDEDPQHARLVTQMLAQDRTMVASQAKSLSQARAGIILGEHDAILVTQTGNNEETLELLHHLAQLAPTAATVLLTNTKDAAYHGRVLRLGIQEIILRGTLGRQAVAARVRHAVQRNQHRLQQERFIRDLRLREASQQEVVLRSADGMLVVDVRGIVVFANPAAQALLSAHQQPLVGSHFAYNLSPLRSRELEIGEGAEQIFAELTQVEIDWNGAKAHLVTLRNVTEKHRAQALRRQLVHAERLAAIGQLAAGVAHEINNPAAYVVANLTAMLRATEAAASAPFGHRELREMKEMLRENLEGMQRIRSITSDLRNFARIDSNEVVEVSLNECVETACKIAFNEIRHRAHLLKELGDVPKIAASPGKLSQVLTNLLVNAAQAIPEGSAEKHRILVETGATDESVWVQVSDNGNGVPEDVLDKIFDPFFTTKERAQGTGLGLALCADIVRQHGGEIAASNLKTGGACFRVEFPSDTQLQPTVRPPSASAELQRSQERLRLLFIDDEPLVLRSIKRMLSEHEVTTANDALEALEILKHDAVVDVIFCDLMMPRMDGPAFYEALEKARPDLVSRVVFLSGGAFTPRAKKFLEQSTRPLLEKPLTLEAFEQFACNITPAPALRLVGAG